MTQCLESIQKEKLMQLHKKTVGVGVVAVIALLISLRLFLGLFPGLFTSGAIKTSQPDPSTTTTYDASTEVKDREFRKDFSSIRDRANVAILVGSKQLSVEVVSSAQSHTLGLSNRDAIGADGMLFVFPREAKYSFWMKDMRFDLDFVWIANGSIVAIDPQIQHPAIGVSVSNLDSYAPPVPVIAMLEVPAGFAQQQGLKVGDSVTLVR